MDASTEGRVGCIFVHYRRARGMGEPADCWLDRAYFAAPAADCEVGDSPAA